MAFEIKHLKHAGPGRYRYDSDDSPATVAAANYFVDAVEQLRVGDVIDCLHVTYESDGRTIATVISIYRLIVSTVIVRGSGGAVATVLITEDGIAGTSGDVRLYGAVGDGVTDDTAAFVAAFASGYPVYVPKGTYSVSAADYTAGVYVFGDGPESVIKWRNTSGSESLFDFITNEMDVFFRDLTIDCNRSVHTDTADYFAAIDFRAPSGSTLELRNVRFLNGRIVDVFVRGPTASGSFLTFVMEGCEFSDGLVGSATRAAACVRVNDAVHCRWINNRATLPTKPTTYGRAGFVHDGANRNGTDERGTIIAMANEFDNIGRGTADTLGCIDAYYGVDDVVIVGNRAKQVCGRFVSTKGDQSRIVIADNEVRDVFDSVPATAVGFAMFQDLYDSSVDRQFLLSNNVVGSSDGYAVFFDGISSAGASNYADVTIANLVARDCDIAGILIRSASGALIENPHIVGCPAAVSFTDMTGALRIVGGRLSGQTNDCIDGHTGVGANTSCDFSIQGTLIESCTDNAIQLTAVRSYDINADINGCDIAYVTAGSTELSRIRGRVRAANSIWSKSGTDTQTDFAIESSVALNFAPREVTIATGAITVHADWHWVDTEADAATDDLDTINGGYDGKVIRLFASSSARDVVLRDGAGNLLLAGNFTLSHQNDSITLIKRGSSWVELSRSDNDA